MELDPRRLLVLLTILRTGGIVAAADELCLSASAVSQQLSRLEKEVGSTLVTRTPHGTVPTDAGLILAKTAEDVERALSVARSRLLGNASGAQGRIRIGSISSFLRSAIIPNLARWHERYPNLEIHLEEHDSQSSTTQLLRAGELDAAIVELNPGDAEHNALPSGMTQELLLDDPWRLLVPTGVLSSGDETELSRIRLPWLETDASVVHRNAIRLIREAIGAPESSAHRYQQPLTALALVKAGQGMVAMPLLALHDLHLDGIDAIDIPGVGPRRIMIRRLDWKHPQYTPVDSFVGLARQAVDDLGLPAVEHAPGSET